MTNADMLVACQGDEQHDGEVVAVRAGAPTPHARGAVVEPACLALHPRLPILYAASGSGRGALHRWSYGQDGLRLLGSTSSGGTEPCHLAVDPSGRLLVIVNYGSGSLGVVGLDEEGAPRTEPQLVQLEGGGPVPSRQGSAHPHQAVFSPDGEHLLVTDLGADVVRVFVVDRPSCQLHLAGACAVPAGTGPRHVVLTGTGSVVITGELSQTVLHGEVDWARAEVRGWNVLPSTRQAATGSPNYPGDLVLDDDHGVVHVANRGLDTISSYSVRSGGIEVMSEVNAGGRWPQHMALVDGALLVAARDSSAVVRFDVHADSGTIDGGAPTTLFHLPRPVWILSSRRAPT